MVTGGSFLQGYFSVVDNYVYYNDLFDLRRTPKADGGPVT